MRERAPLARLRHPLPGLWGVAVPVLFVALNEGAAALAGRPLPWWCILLFLPAAYGAAVAARRRLVRPPR